MSLRIYFLSVALLATALAWAGEKARPFRIADPFANEQFSAFSYAPDGKALAFIRRRPANSQMTSGYRMAEAREDIWIADDAGEARNLTNGASDGSGWWAPHWSPDGARLLMYGSRGGGVRAWVWNRASNTLEPASDAAVDFYYRSSNNRYDQGCHWASNTSILCVTYPDGAPRPPLGTSSYYTGRYIEQAKAVWAKAERGEVSASEVDSLRFPMPQRALTLIDVASRSSKTFATTQSSPFYPTGQRSFWLSRGIGAIALIKPAFASAFPEAIRCSIGYPADIEIRKLDGTAIATDRPLPTNVVTTSVQWSPDGSRLAFFATEERLFDPQILYGEAAQSVEYPAVTSRAYPGRLFTVEVGTGHVASIDTSGFDLGIGKTPPQMIWLPGNELALDVAPVRKASLMNEIKPTRWIVVGADGGTRPLVRNLNGDYRLAAISLSTLADQGATGTLIGAVDHARAMLVLADGDLWRFDPAIGDAINLTANLDQPVVAVQRTDEDGQSPLVRIAAGSPRSERDKSELFSATVATNALGRKALGFARNYVLDVSTGALQAITMPPQEAAISALSPNGESVAFNAVGSKGVTVWRGDGGRAPRQIAAANQFWADIARPAERIIEYKSHDGTTLRAKLWLPIDYQPGRRYPIVVDSDIGHEPRYGGYELTEPNENTLADDFDAPTFTSAGYIYVRASMPGGRGTDDIGRANLLTFAGGLVGAADAAVAQGFADPDRVFLFGFSSMAVGVYGTITQTNRFKAAVAAFGWVDHGVKQLELDMRVRYSETPYIRGDFGVQYLDGDLRTWRDGDLLRRNSPLTYVDRVQTPLLMIDSDFDHGWMENSELFFSALVQQRKPAKFVRYFGEAHGTKTPANTLDLYARVLAWFDQWGGIARDANGAIVFDGERARSRVTAPPLAAEDYLRFSFFGTVPRAVDAPLRTGDMPATDIHFSSPTALQQEKGNPPES